MRGACASSAAIRQRGVGVFASLSLARTLAAIGLRKVVEYGGQRMLHSKGRYLVVVRNERVQNLVAIRACEARLVPLLVQLRYHVTLVVVVVVLVSDLATSV